MHRCAMKHDDMTISWCWIQTLKTRRIERKGFGRSRVAIRQTLNRVKGGMISSSNLDRVQILNNALFWYLNVEHVFLNILIGHLHFSDK
jgi:hypothetical protein